MSFTHAFPAFIPGLVGGALMGLLFACNPSPEAGNPADRKLARVHNQTLYLSEMDGMFPNQATAEDSQVIIEAYTFRWIQEALLLHEAERNIPKDLNIDQLVRDYRASLVRNSYENMLMEQFLEDNINQEELLAFYEENKEQYQLETPIIRCNFVKVSLPVPNADRLRNLWNSREEEDKAFLLAYANRYAEAHILEDSTWHRLEDVALEMPEGTLTPGNISSRRDLSLRDGEYQYYLRIFEVKNRKEIAPFSFIEEQARKVILRKRRIELLEQKKQDMYDIELRKGNIETYF